MADRSAPRHDRRNDRGGQRGGPQRRSAQRPARRARSADPARSVAFAVLRAVDEGAYANLELPRRLRQDRVAGRDAAFATELCYGTLRLRGRYDAIIALAGDRGLDSIDPPVLDALRLGVHQLLATRVPSHAAVSATVALVRSEIGVGPSGFVNAVLRRIDERTPDEWDEALREAAGDDPIAQLATEHSHPAWQVRALRAALLGHGAAGPASLDKNIDTELTDLLIEHNRPAEVTLVARPGLVTAEELIRAGALAHPVVPTAATLSGGDPGAIAAIRDGRAAVQDAGSQLVALTLAAAPVEGPDSQWLDLCAGPGGKAGLLAALARGRGASLVANEISPHRAELVRGTLRAAVEAGADVEIVDGDGREAGQRWPERFDRVLVDAPCTGLGALRRRPEARWRRTPADLAGLADLQRALLNAALDATRPGGVVVYATCSPHLAETTFVVQDVLKRRADAIQEDARGPLRSVLRAESAGETGTPWTTGLGDGPTVQLWPHRHHTDGMFLALLRKLSP